jgi:hypothetical protein
MTETERKELFRLLVEVRDGLGSIQRLVGAMPRNKGHERLLTDLIETANSLECELFKELGMTDKVSQSGNPDA